MSEKTILIVDRDEISLHLFGRFLAAVSKNIILEKNGNDALKRLQRQKIDLAIINLSLPGIDGHELAKNIRYIRSGTEYQKKIPIIGIYTCSERDIDYSLFEDCIQVPVDKEIFVKKVTRLIS